MKQSMLIKMLTLTLFTGLIGTFVAYRAGFFKATLDSNSHSSQMDTLQRTDSISLKKQWMPSSKVLILKENDLLKKDSLEPPFHSDSVKIKDPKIMGSSKSGILLTPEILLDSPSTPQKHP
ncbi:hypothetical protein AAG747_25435 [Rapidithrix thailandica]|uniref:Uncharacterized protein n=1 Tax=Rapidithrix thailandica TaxID=413964 RepID=A0AAW9SKM0_9BACT